MLLLLLCAAAVARAGGTTPCFPDATCAYDCGQTQDGSTCQLDPGRCGAAASYACANLTQLGNSVGVSDSPNGPACFSEAKYCNGAATPTAASSSTPISSFVVCPDGSYCVPMDTSSSCTFQFSPPTHVAYECAPACFGASVDCGHSCPLGLACSPGGAYSSCTSTCSRPPTTSFAGDASCGGVCPPGAPCTWGGTGYSCAVADRQPSTAFAAGGVAWRCYSTSSCGGECITYGAGTACTLSAGASAFAGCSTAAYPFYCLPPPPSPPPQPVPSPPTPPFPPGPPGGAGLMAPPPAGPPPPVPMPLPPPTPPACVFSLPNGTCAETRPECFDTQSCGFDGCPASYICVWSDSMPGQACDYPGGYYCALVLQTASVGANLGVAIGLPLGVAALLLLVCMCLMHEKRTDAEAAKLLELQPPRDSEGYLIGDPTRY